MYTIKVRFFLVIFETYGGAKICDRLCMFFKLTDIALYWLRTLPQCVTVYTERPGVRHGYTVDWWVTLAYLCIVISSQGTPMKDVTLKPDAPKDLLLDKHVEYIAKYGTKKDDYVIKIDWLLPETRLSWLWTVFVALRSNFHEYYLSLLIALD